MARQPLDPISERLQRVDDWKTEWSADICSKTQICIKVASQAAKLEDSRTDRWLVVNLTSKVLFGFT